VVIGAARALGWQVRRVLDDSPSSWGTLLMGVPVEGGSSLLEEGEPCHIAIGHNETRLKLASSLQGLWTTIVHPSAFVDPSALVGEGVLICAGAVVQPEASIGPFSIINTKASVDHECLLERGAQAAPGASLGGRVVMEEGAFAGIGCSIHQGSRLGAWSVLGGGAFLKGSIPPGEVWAGVPARPLSRRESQPSS
jgi:sugar O-acyltransferase (sialic acid O-acetyltransferase NeuD family)